jgi:hypothetical protein
MPLWIVMSACSYATKVLEPLSEAFGASGLVAAVAGMLACIALVAIFEAFSR